MSWIQPAVEGVIPMARNAHTMNVVANKLILFGGHSGNKHLKDLHIFDTETLRWSEPDVYGTPPKGLRGHTTNLIGNKIYLFGGYDGRGRSNDLFILNVETMTWNHPIDTERPPSGRQRHSACAVNNRQLYIFGGFDGNKWLNDVNILDVVKLEDNAIAVEASVNLAQNMKKLINNELFSDVTFVVEGRQIFAHKVILVT
jgi:N-acetylneuraminic acid mutarotase